MGSTKKSVRLTDSTVAVCQALTTKGGDINWSAAINSMAEQYLLLICEAAPALHDQHWQWIYNCCRDYEPLANLNHELSFLPTRLKEYAKTVEKEAAAFAEISDLTTLVENMTKSERVALIYRAREHNSQFDNGDNCGQ